MITDAQIRYIQNNCPADLIADGSLNDDSLLKLSKEEASSIISDMLAGQFTKEALGSVGGYMEFWKKVSQFIRSGVFKAAE